MDWTTKARLGAAQALRRRDGRLGLAVAVASAVVPRLWQAVEVMDTAEFILEHATDLPQIPIADLPLGNPWQWSLAAGLALFGVAVYRTGSSLEAKLHLRHALELMAPAYNQALLSLKDACDNLDGWATPYMPHLPLSRLLRKYVITEALESSRKVAEAFANDHCSHASTLAAVDEYCASYSELLEYVGPDDYVVGLDYKAHSAWAQHHSFFLAHARARANEPGFIELSAALRRHGLLSDDAEEEAAE